MNQRIIAIYGSKTFARLINQMMQADFGLSATCYLDDFNTSHGEDELDIISLHAAISQYGKEFEVVLGIGYADLSTRLKLLEKIDSLGLSLLSLVHPSAIISKSATIAKGAIIMQNAFVGENVQIGRGSVLWPSVNVSHDVKVEDNCFLSPSVVICGFSHIGQSSFIGANATVVDRVDVPNGSFIKAGRTYTGKT